MKKRHSGNAGDDLIPEADRKSADGALLEQFLENKLHCEEGTCNK